MAVILRNRYFALFAKVLLDSYEIEMKEVMKSMGSVKKWCTGFFDFSSKLYWLFLINNWQFDYESIFF
jgi:hypothetical protein